MTPTPRSFSAIALCLAAIALLTAADLGSKHWALDRLSRAPISDPGEACTPGADHQRLSKAPIVLVDGYLQFSYAENCGAAFGFMRDMPQLVRKGVFYTAAIGVGIVLMWMLVTGRGSRLFVWSIPLIIAGAIGNLVDRVRLGYVVDFIRFHLNDRWAYPTFNVADAWITIGVALILIDTFIQGRNERQQAAAEQKAAP